MKNGPVSFVDISIESFNVLYYCSFRDVMIIVL